MDGVKRSLVVRQQKQKRKGVLGTYFSFDWKVHI